MEKEYYVIQNENGKFFAYDNTSGGYPCFIDDFKFCKNYKTRSSAESFLVSDYSKNLFKKEFNNCVVRKVVMRLV